MSENMSAPRPSKRPVTVVAGVIERDGLLLVCQRRHNDSHPFKWEFPGGKVERGETPRAALERELQEELAIQATIGPEISRSLHRTEGRSPLRLIFFRVSGFHGEPANRAFEQIRWEEPSKLPEYDFVEADTGVVRLLSGGSMSIWPKA
jgi:8-oxo-dGTP diphosphatase